MIGQAQQFNKTYVWVSGVILFFMALKMLLFPDGYIHYQRSEPYYSRMIETAKYEMVRRSYDTSFSLQGVGKATMKAIETITEPNKHNSISYASLIKSEMLKPVRNADNMLPFNVPYSDSVMAKTREFIKMKFGRLYLFGAVSGNTTDTNEWDIVKVYGSFETKIFMNSNLTCCFLYKIGNETFTKRVAIIVERYHKRSTAMRMFYVACPNVLHTFNIVPIGMAITVKNFTCSSEHVAYIQPYFPLRQPNKIAIGTKTAFGNISPELIIEWMEAYKYLGVDKVVTYYIRSINEDALKVLKYYVSTGILDLTYYVPAAEEKFPRISDFGTKNTQRWNDQQLMVHDSFERMSGYDYFGIIDHDEFFVPARHRTLKEMLSELRQTYKSSAGYILLAQYYFLTWGPTSNSSDLILGRYTQREGSKARLDMNKNIYIPRRVSVGKVHTHVVNAAKGYRMYTLKSDYGYIRHFRQCRKNIYTKCMNQTKRVEDNEVLEWSMAFRDNVIKVRDFLFSP